MDDTVRQATADRRRGYTLLELLIVVAVLGVASALLVPSISQANNLRVQATVRTIVADITFAQSDAIAYQERRAILFDLDDSGDPWDNGYVITEVNGNGVPNPMTDALYDPNGLDGRHAVSFNHPQYDGSQITAVDFADSTNLYFDELGSPVTTPGGSEAASGSIVVEGSGQVFRITVEPFSGRVRTENITPPPGPVAP